MESFSYKKGYYEVRFADQPEDYSKLNAFYKANGGTGQILGPVKRHLIIVDKRKSQILGACGLICSPETSSFVSNQIYDLQNLETKPGLKIELSYLFISNCSEESIITQVFWTGLKLYGETLGANFLFTCIPVRLGREGLTSNVFQSLRRLGRVASSFSLAPKTKLGLTDECKSPLFDSLFGLRHSLTPQLNFLLNWGGQICGHPGFHNTYQSAVVPTLITLQDQMQKPFKH